MADGFGGGWSERANFSNYEREYYWLFGLIATILL